jgi:acetyl-CoA C-acetyltransferase
MPYVASIGTYLPYWAAPLHRVAGDDEDAVTLAVEAGRSAQFASGAVVEITLVDSVMHQHKPDMTTFPATTRAAKQAFAMASMTPVDADVTEIRDFFTGIEIISYEDLGFAERFGGYKLVEAEVTSVGGALPVNPSWGLKAKGHPPGATGVAQCVELFAQLRGEAVNQVDGARVALAHNIGGPTAVSAVTVLEGSSNGPW